MNRKALYSNIIALLPSDYDEEKGFVNHVKALFSDYKKLLRELEPSEQPSTWNTTLDQIDHLTNSLERVIDLVYRGLISESHRVFNSCIKLNELLKTVTFKESENWYRMRIMDTKRNDFEYENMFHIPLNKRGIVKTQRYSAPGYPCLYLGTSIYICWEELHRPNLNSCFVSQVVNKFKITLFDMTCPIESDWINNHSFSETDNSALKKDNDNDKILDNTIDNNFTLDILRLPLVLASMIRVKNDDDIFKPEYIIPQQIMESIIEMNNHNNDNSSEDRIFGVLYTTVLKNKDFSFYFGKQDKGKELTLKNNLAIPVQKPNEGNYCDELIKVFQITKPTCEEYERAKKQFESMHYHDIESNQFPYDASVFGQLEARLSDRKSFPLYTITNINSCDS